MDPPRGEHLVINGFDITDATYRMKLALKNQPWKLSLEDYLHQILASTSVLLLTPCAFSDKIQSFFEQENWTAASAAIENIYKIQQPCLPMTLQPGFFRSLSFAHALLIHFSRICFDEPDQGVYLRWTNEITLEAKQLSCNMRPDLTITKTVGLKWAKSLGYGEAKPAARETDHYLVCQDLIKVALFCKHSLDEQLMDGVLGIHIVGQIKVPDSIKGLSGFIPELPSILKVLGVFDSVCVCSLTPDVIARRRAPTLPSKTFQHIISESKSRKRSCHLRRRRT
ncbi:uncharacterized protein BYT42DRAFT_592897 [Radiomyces spectabilis]|uniref:uncharacterized protein n=1 Tax=Radiomyces spectabilis TaxID=64574 RepID=UPI002220EFF2|nr:uncharacterized protein BYT42DRAFT_592897 [Radiomyces spectabilis]KAI8384869.1 hypothetical protein BYT42DRAFT_592897 [Radiomyces spectabilis]